MSGEAKEPIQIMITLDPNTGEVSVNGPLQNEILVYGLLEKARQITADYARPKVLPASVLPFQRTN